MELSECFRKNFIKEKLNTIQYDANNEKKEKQLYIWLNDHNIMVKKDNKIIILTYLIENKDKEFSILQLSKNLHIDYKTTYLTIKKLENSVHTRKQSKSNFISLKRELTEDIYLTESQRRKQTVQSKNLKILVKEIENINEQFILLLFGSYVNSKQTKNSDIDLLLISDNAKQIKEHIEILPLAIHLTSITNKEFHTMLLSKKFSVVSEAIQNNSILFGIEPYYRFLKNAK